MNTSYLSGRGRSFRLQRIGVLLCLCFLLSIFIMPAMRPQAASRSKNITMNAGQSVKLSLKGCSQSLLWKVSTGSKLVSMDPNGTLTAKSKGNAVVKTVYGGLTYQFKVKIRKQKAGQSTEVKEYSLTAKKASTTATQATVSGKKIPRAGLANSTDGSKVAEENLILIGDSRFLGMHAAVGGKATWFYETGEGLTWMKENVLPKLAAMDVSKKVIVFNIGINDLWMNPQTYVTELNQIGKDLRKRKATVYFMTVNPVDEKVEKKYGYVAKNKTVVAFNQKVVKSLVGFGIIDTYDYLAEHGFTTVDGLHYKADTYKAIYSVMSEAIEKKTMTGA